MLSATPQLTAARSSYPNTAAAIGRNSTPHATWGGPLASAIWGRPNLEQLVVLKPDLILFAKVRHEQLYDQLSKIAPTVFNTTGAS